MTNDARRPIKGNILTPAGWVHGALRFGARVDGIDGRRADPANNDDVYIVPGFIDVHVHGGAGRDMMEGGDAPHVIAALHAKHGTTSLLATTMTAPVEDIDRALSAIGAACAARGKGEARILGVHLEGPYINSGKLGAQPPFAREAHLDEVMRFHAMAPMKLITVAPEIDGHMALVRQLTKAGIRVQIGHTNGDYDVGVAALAHGAAGFTHLFNAMPGLHHRDPGMVGAALAHAEYAEIIPDLMHVHPGAIRTALRCIPKLFCVTDSTAAAGMPDGEYMLGRQVVHKCMGGVRLADGTLAGSTLTMDQALRNLVGMGLSIEDASQRVSTHAADYLGETRRGRLAPGCHADFVVLDRALNIKAVYIEGECLVNATPATADGHQSLMLQEALSSGDCVAHALTQDADRYAALGEQLRATQLHSAVTVARGSSDHASGYLAYLIMSRMGRLVTSLPMSLITLYKSPIIARDTLAIAISQSGQSPDVVEPMQYFRAGGAVTVALVNDAASPLADAAEWTMPLHAGKEHSVAATKSFIASLVAGARLVAEWQNDPELKDGIAALPDALRAARSFGQDGDWSAAIDVLAPARNIMVVGRGISFPLALEAALKFKETSALQAEAFSGAEIKHGPMALIEDGYPLLIFATRGPTQASLVALADDMRARGARVLLAAPADIASRDLTLPTAAIPDLDPIVAAQAFYTMAAKLSAARGMNADQPRHLSKVTKTN